jgi:hypothetical protein
MAQGLAGHLGLFLAPLVFQLDRVMDKRLLRTLVQTVQTIICFRDRINGLLLSELGGYLLHPSQAPAGTKRLSNLLHSPKWRAQDVDTYLWQQAEQQVEVCQQAGEVALAIWDSSEWEKPESEASEDLCAVRSSKAHRLTHIKPGYYHRPTRPVFVPGLHWSGVLVVGLSAQASPPLLALLHYWTSRGVHASFKRDEEGKVLQQLRAWGRKVMHVFDRGYASGFWIGLLLDFELRFVLRFKGKNHLLDAAGNRRACWRIPFGKRGWEERVVWDSRRAMKVHASVLALPVSHPQSPDQPLWLVVCRSKGREPWYLLTSEAIKTAEDAWRLVACYVRRWQIEQTWRYDKSEWAFQSPRVWSWEVRRKLLALATLAYAFLLLLLQPRYGPLRLWLFRRYCHRTGSRLRQVKAPLYRLRSALARLWQAHPPHWRQEASGRATSAEAGGQVPEGIIVESWPPSGPFSAAGQS